MSQFGLCYAVAIAIRYAYCEGATAGCVTLIPIWAFPLEVI